MGERITIHLTFLASKAKFNWTRRLIMASVRRRTWKTASGEAKAAWVVDYTDSRGDRQRKHFLNKKAADAFRIHIEGQMQAGTYRPNADKVTVKEVCESFLDIARAETNAMSA